MYLNFTSKKQWIFTLLLSINIFGSENFQVVELDHPQREEILSTIDYRSEDLASKNKMIVKAAVDELVDPLAGKEAKKRYGAKSYEWWCSEFSRYVIFKSAYFGKDQSKGKRILDIGLSSKLIKFFENEENGVYFKDMNKKTKIKAGDYLAYTSSGTKPNHSSIVVYVSYEKNFILTAEGNADLNNRVALIKRPILIDGKMNGDFYFLGKVK